MASPLINAAGVSKSYGARTLFEGVDLVIEAGDRVGVIGPNGAGKTTLLEILAGEAAPDDGTVTRRRGLRVGYVPQEERLDPGATVLATALAAAEEAAEPSVVETEVEREVRARIAVERAGFADPDQPVGELSGGWRKRAAVAAALARDPEVLLLDEPTNHLDLQGIVWLEQLLASGGPAYVVISHDRAFLERTARRMLEVAPEYPGGVLAVEGSYGAFVEQRKAYLKARERYRDSLANQARREQEWLDRGPKARTSKAQDRIDRAGRIKEELGDLDRGRRPDPIGLELEGSGRRTKRLLVAEGLGASVAGRRLFGGLDFVLSPGRRVGVVGPNGSGKTTMLRILAGEREPEAGTVRTADGLEAVYFDQTREHLELDRPLRWALAGAADRVVYRGQAVHVAGWAGRFGFRGDQLDLPVSELSGGERARVHIARLMLRPADLLLLDEPTNDLDIRTLEVLEESLVDFPGAVVIVTHDRVLLDRACTTLLGLDGEGGAGWYADAEQWRRELAERRRPTGAKSGSGPRRRPGRSKGGLTHREKREYAEMEATILEAEAELAAASERLDDPQVATDPERAHEAFEARRRAQEQVDRLYERWAELEAKAAAAEG